MSYFLIQLLFVIGKVFLVMLKHIYLQLNIFGYIISHNIQKKTFLSVIAFLVLVILV